MSMRSFTPPGLQTGRSSVAAFLAISFLTSFAALAEERTLIRVEEDWMVLIEETDDDAASPQVNNVIAFASSQSGLYGMIELNHSTYPSFHAGGIQVQARNDENVIASQTYRDGIALDRDFDRLEYTVSLFHSGEHTWVGIKNIRSKTWGDSGSTETRAQIASYRKSLSNYTPDHSASASSVNVGAQRVATMCMPRVRYYYSNGDVETEEKTRFAERYRTSESVIDIDDFSSDGSAAIQ
ncbi:MAG: hypothetical protein JNL58_04770 [Planctomyces sp.]|nr:hypothetical protein [Planctomyces sp.]